MPEHYPRLIIAGTNSGSGKTTITMGLILALRARGYDVRPFKTGPDYIDPGFLTLAAGCPARNLDTVMEKEEVLGLLFKRALSEDPRHITGGGRPLAIIEGVMGLYDGFSGTGGAASGKLEVPADWGSTAHLAKVLEAPVVLLVSAKAMARSAAALVKGFIEFDPELSFGGIIFNNLGSEKHYRMVKTAVERMLKESTREGAREIRVLGYLPHNRDIVLPERHLGLVPAWERKALPDSVHTVAKMLEETVDLAGIIDLAKESGPLKKGGTSENGMAFLQNPTVISKTERVKIAYALDDAFHFYYEDNLDILREAGAELVPFSPIKDRGLPPKVLGLYLGGGYPELFAGDLEKNGEMLQAVFASAEAGLPIYAECGGLMYLMEELVDFEGRSFTLAGVFKGRVVMEKKLSALGYYYGRAIKSSPIAEKDWALWGHVFHWSRLEGTEDDSVFSFELTKDPGNDTIGEEDKKGIILDGLLKNNTLAGYFHIHFAGDLRWPERFVKTCKGEGIDGTFTR